MSEALLEVESLCAHYQAGGRGLFAREASVVRAVDGVSFSLGRGETLGLVGESGSGKTTTARALVGLVRPASGSIRLEGVELAQASPREWRKARRRIQLVFQDPSSSLDPRQSIGSIVTEPLMIHRIGKTRERRMRALALLEAVGLLPSAWTRYPHEFSGGQRQRIAIARALALEPEILICDEPVSALDVSVRAQVLNLLKELQERFGLATLLIAHDLAIVRHLCARVAVMYLGRVVEIAPRDELYAAPRHPYTRALLSAVPVVDPQAKAPRERIVLSGDPPSPLHPPSGCAFHPRCPERARVPGERCVRERPELRSVAGEARSFACHLEQ